MIIPLDGGIVGDVDFQALGRPHSIHLGVGSDGRQRNSLFDALNRDNQRTIFDFHSSILLQEGMGGPLGGPARLHDTGHMTHYTFARRPPMFVYECDAAKLT